ncbi:hypothetical protein ACOMHN_007981 [Nucella lapillus]
MDKLKRAFGGNDEQEDKGVVAQISDASTLSWSTRIKLFALCFILGATLSILGTCLLVLKNGLIIFAILYTLGNILSLASTCFLMGPLNQLKKMFAKTRVIATALVLIMFVLTLVFALAVKSTPLAILCCVLQFLALVWYSLSYVPYARDVAKKCFTSCLE